MSGPPGNAAMPASVAAVVLAAGAGMRMKSAKPKPLHEVAGLPMVAHVLRAVEAVQPESVTVVGSPGLQLDFDDSSSLRLAIQDPPRGTGDAVAAGMVDQSRARWTLIVYADHPLITGEELTTLIDEAERTNPRLCLLTCLVDDAAGYGRIARGPTGEIEAIVERIDDESAMRQGVTEINTGIMLLDSDWAVDALKSINPHPVKGEYFLTDLVSIAAEQGENGITSVAGKPETLLGVNDRRELSQVDAMMRARIRNQHMADGVTMIGADQVLIDVDVEIGADTVLKPGAFLGRGSQVGRDCVIGPDTTIERSRIGNGSTVERSVVRDSVVGARTHVGPFSHIRAGSQLSDDIHIGNFGEIKNSRLASRSRSGHFSYLGDATIGHDVNVGAGTVTCNYDGVDKHATEIGDRAFIGSDTMLIAPVSVGNDGRTGAGSVVTKDVESGATVAGVPARLVKRRQTKD